MPASAARIAANQANALKSSGPRTEEGKAISRANSLKHGLTGGGIVLAERDAAEVRRRAAAFEADLRPTDEVGRALVHRAALMAVRMEQGARQQLAATAEHVALAVADFDEEWPEGEGPADPARARARSIVADSALFDPSKEACLARKYEASAERTFFLALKELRQHQAAKAEAPSPAESPEFEAKMLGSILQLEEQLAAIEARKARPEPTRAAKAPVRPSPAHLPPIGGHVDVPFTIGRRR